MSAPAGPGPANLALAAAVWLPVATAGLAGAAAAVTTAVAFARRPRSLERRLAGYELEPALAGDRSDGPAAGARGDSIVVRSGIAAAERLAARSGLGGAVDRMLEQADVPVRAGELLFYVPVFGLLTFLLLGTLGGALAGLAAAGVGALTVFALLERRRSTRLRRFELQLPATLALLAGTLRAGFSLMQGLETVAAESREPVRRELTRVFTEVRLGRSVEDALGEVAGRMASTDLAWTAMAIRIQREVGGNLAALLDTIADTMQKRERLRREVRALTAEGRVSAVVLTLFAPGIALALLVLSPGYLDILFERPVGVVAIVGAAIANVVGWFWLRRVVNLEG